jgi:hypothetical protein
MPGVRRMRPRSILTTSATPDAPIRWHHGGMGLFTQRPEQNEEWAGIPSEPLRVESDAERLADAAPVDAGGLALDGVGMAVESIVIPVAPVIEIVEAQESGEGGEPEADDA